jgi:SAM-dependent methyltransferase
MPEEAYWETLFDVPLILDRLGVDARLRNVVEFGCGYGTFTVPVARRISGTVTTFDIDEAMIERTRERAAAAGAYNVVYVVRDVFADGFGGEAGSKDACLLFNILHCEEPVRLLAEAARVVRPRGAVLVIHWRYDPVQIAMLKGLVAGSVTTAAGLALGAKVPSAPILLAVGVIGLCGYGLSLTLFVLAACRT